ncbi:MAG TPA: TetR/AcrR family transcriptional regulator [Gaiellaceae bacterium]|nr:TetR/AcrR family transcriptional regulator [Gaiellaceae bacterium]
MTDVGHDALPEAAGRREILNAATELFAAKGYSRVSIRELAARAGCSTSNLYHHFSSKYEIFVTLVEGVMGEHHAGVRDALERFDDPVEQLAFVLRNHLLVHMRRPEVRLVSADFHPLDGPALDRFIAERDRYERAVREIVARGVEEGLLDAQDPAIAVRAAMGACTAVEQWFRPSGPLSDEEVADRIAGFLLAAFGATRTAAVSR